MADAKAIWTALKNKGFTDYAVAGIMGNLYAESGLEPNNLQNNGNTKLGLTDAQFTAKVDNGTYAKNTFIHDGYGYGLAQWTYYSLKEELYDYAKKKGTSIADVNMQIDLLYTQLTNNKLVTSLNNAKSVLEASNVMLLKFERPADQSTSVQNKRASYGEKYYNQYASTVTTVSSTNTSLPYTVRVTANVLNIRSGPGTSYAINGSIRDKGVYTIVEEVTNADGTKWGKLKSGLGYISLSYCKKL